MRGGAAFAHTHTHTHTDVPAAAATLRREAALKQYDELSLARLDEVETKRAADAKKAQETAAKLNRAELAAREVKEPATLAAHLKGVVEIEGAERDRVLVAALEAWQRDGAGEGTLAEVERRSQGSRYR